MARYWRALAWPEFSGLDPAVTVAVLPVAAIEQHGPHLPVGVDDYINQGVVEAAMPLMPDSVLVLPACHVGQVERAYRVSGDADAVGRETLIRVWTEIGEGVARAGVRKFVMLNSHGGSRR